MDMSEQVRDLANKFLTPYREHNRQLIARLCPFCKGGAHGDENTFAVGLYNGAYNCMRGSCGVSGSFRELCEFFGQKAPESTGTPLPFSQKHKRYELPDETILHPLTEECEAYLARRGISRATMDAFHVSSDENGNIILGIEEIKAEGNSKSDKSIYDLQGRKIPNDKDIPHGIYIRDGKKIAR